MYTTPNRIVFFSNEGNFRAIYKRLDISDGSGPKSTGPGRARALKVGPGPGPGLSPSLEAGPRAGPGLGPLPNTPIK